MYNLLLFWLLHDSMSTLKWRGYTLAAHPSCQGPWLKFPRWPNQRYVIKEGSSGWDDYALAQSDGPCCETIVRALAWIMGSGSQAVGELACRGGRALYIGQVN